MCVVKASENGNSLTKILTGKHFLESVYAFSAILNHNENAHVLSIQIGLLRSREFIIFLKDKMCLIEQVLFEEMVLIFLGVFNGKSNLLIVNFTEWAKNN